ncbi:MAG: NAD-dependent epimerase/dehydratase family protein [Bacteroidetes bacterium]|nr:NAD-dependent epimerase/dehydratase family protein [Bacteroidota bacterium]
MTKILLTGGSGFLGRAIVAELTDPSSPLKFSHLRVFDLKEYSGPEKDLMEFISGDIRDYSAVLEACRGMDMVIHSAAVVDWGTKSDEEIFSVNFRGTENVLKACTELNIRHLVYTSSLDAIFGGKPLVNIDETIAYPEKHPNSYCRSKYLSEKLVLEANNGAISTCVLRPSDIYGEGDPFHVGSLIDMAKGGFYVRLGNGKSKSQHVYVRNMAYAHLLAAHALLSGNKAVPGNAYLITDGPGHNFFHFFDRIVEGAGYRIWPKNLWLPRDFAMMVGFFSEMIAVAARPVKRYTPKMSRFAVIYTCTDFTFSSEKAKRDFGFVPKYSAEEAFERTVSFYKKG